jgi:hypothetical protein
MSIIILFLFLLLGTEKGGEEHKPPLQGATLSMPLKL